jgi:N-hydroxyarylamine O-acetyltransferase
MAPEPSPVSAFEPHHRRLSTDPESSFVRTLVVQRPCPDRIVSLRARTLTEVGPDVDSLRVLADAREFTEVLAGFGLRLDDARLRRLWAAAREQHESFLATRPPAWTLSSDT